MKQVSRTRCRRTHGGPGLCRPRLLRRRRSGMALILTLVVVGLLSLAAYSFTMLMLAERQGTVVNGRQLQSRALAESGVALIERQLMLTPDELTESGGLYDNAGRFQGVLVRDDDLPRDRGRVAVLAVNVVDGRPGGVRYGLDNESNRLNINVVAALDAQQVGAGREILMALPGMTEETADAILDWTDSDDEQREFGAEIDYYTTLDPPYSPANAPLKTIDELLLVRGITPELLYGADLDRNGLPDPDISSESVGGIDNSEGLLDLGWAAYLTLYSAETNLRPDGSPRIDLNADDLETLHADLAEIIEEDWATFIIAYRQNGPYRSGGNSGGSGTSGGGGAAGGTGASGGSTNAGGGGRTSGQASGGSTSSGSGTTAPGGTTSAGGTTTPGGTTSAGGTTGGSNNQTPSLLTLPGEAVGGRKLDLTQSGSNRLTTVLDLIGVQVQVTFQGANQAVVVDSPFSPLPLLMSTYLTDFLDNVAVNPAPAIPGRININQAPRAILAGIPGIAPELVDEIVSKRSPEPEDGDDDRRHETWLLTEGLVTLDEMKSLLPYVTAGGRVYRAQVVGYFEDSGPATRVEVVFDATTPVPRLLFWRDLGHLGRGHPVETLGLGAQ